MNTQIPEPVTRDELFFTPDFDSGARHKLTKRFSAFVSATHEARGERITRHFARKQAELMIHWALDDLFQEAEDDLGNFNAGEPTTPPEWDDARIAEAVSNAEGEYLDKLNGGWIKLPRQRAA